MAWGLAAWRNIDEVELATFERVDWFNHRRQFGPIGHVPPAKAERDIYVANLSPPDPVGLTPEPVHEPGTLQSDRLRIDVVNGTAPLTRAHQLPPEARPMERLHPNPMVARDLSVQ